MALEIDNYYRDFKNLFDECKKHINYHVVLTMKDGSTIDGIIEKVDGDNVVVLVGEDVMESELGSKGNETRQGYNYGPSMGRFRRFQPRVFPFGALAALTLLRYPYYAPPYPYYAPYPYYPY